MIAARDDSLFLVMQEGVPSRGTSSCVPGQGSSRCQPFSRVMDTPL
ncbi:hypothetical protein ASZ90_015219 [hydrocarbon metagenome]|uniref:Uncharacterized protein n=1 Tax=hydrocarbon metagenome TaxID=938273 RepID=A0A0W8F2J9_9ZZZZ